MILILSLSRQYFLKTVPYLILHKTMQNQFQLKQNVTFLHHKKCSHDHMQKQHILTPHCGLENIFGDLSNIRVFLGSCTMQKIYVFLLYVAKDHRDALAEM